MNLQGEKTSRASQQDMGWRAQRTCSLLPVAGKVFLLTLPFIERACGYLEGWPPGFPAKRNHACSRLVLRLARRNGSVRCGRVCSKIVYSVRIGPTQPTSKLSPSQTKDQSLLNGPSAAARP